MFIGNTFSKLSSRPDHALITFRKDLIEGMEMADACSLVTHLPNSITGRLYEYHRVVTAFRLHSVRNLKIQAPYASAVESCLSRKFVRSCFYFSRRLFFAKQFRHPLTDFRSVFFIAGPMCNIMVRFPNGSRTHISLSADSSLKVRSEQRQDFKLVKN